MKEDTNSIQNLAHLVKANRLFYNKLPSGELEDHIIRMIERLKMQKDLFLKEIANTADTQVADIISEPESDEILSHHSTISKYNEAISNNDVEGCLSFLIEIEELLYNKYHAYLFEQKPDEITKMILRNQANEIKRDIKILNNLYEYA